MEIIMIVMAIIAILLEIVSFALFLSDVDENFCLSIILLTIGALILIFIMVSYVKSYNKDIENIETEITSIYPDAIITSDNNSFIANGKNYTYRVDGKNIIVIDGDNNATVIRNSKIINNTIETTSINNDSKQTEITINIIKFSILNAYSDNIIDVSYIESSNSGYFKINDEYFKFTVEDNNIVVKDGSNKITNIIEINK